MSGQKEDNQILISASAFSLLQYIILVEVCEDNLASGRSCPWKVKYLVGLPKGSWGSLGFFIPHFENHWYLDLCYAKCSSYTSRSCILRALLKNVKFWPHPRWIEWKPSFYKIQRWFMYILKFGKCELEQQSSEVPVSSVYFIFDQVN